MRHAKSSWDEMELSDHQRPLNKRGKRDAPIIATEIAKRYAPQLILSSSSQRTRETYSYLEEALPQHQVEFSDSLYLASAIEILSKINEVSNEYTDILILAHNPGITEAFLHLANVRIDNVPTSGVGCILFNTVKFSEVKAGKGELEFFTYPKNLN